MGFIAGVNLEPRHLAAARALVHDANPTNVEIVKRDIYDTRSPRDAFDFVHARTSKHRGLGAQVSAAAQKTKGER